MWKIHPRRGHQSARLLDEPDRGMAGLQRLNCAWLDSAQHQLRNWYLPFPSSNLFPRIRNISCSGTMMTRLHSDGVMSGFRFLHRAGPRVWTTHTAQFPDRLGALRSSRDQQAQAAVTSLPSRPQLPLAHHEPRNGHTIAQSMSRSRLCFNCIYLYY